jgi:hypothetical protein
MAITATSILVVTVITGIGAGISCIDCTQIEHSAAVGLFSWRIEEHSYCVCYKITRYGETRFEHSS